VRIVKRKLRFALPIDPTRDVKNKLCFLRVFLNILVVVSGSFLIQDITGTLQRRVDIYFVGEKYPGPEITNCFGSILFSIYCKPV
jgi:hypothetical protein